MQDEYKKIKQGLFVELNENFTWLADKLGVTKQVMSYRMSAIRKGSGHKFLKEINKKIEEEKNERKNSRNT